MRALHKILVFLVLPFTPLMLQLLRLMMFCLSLVWVLLHQPVFVFAAEDGTPPPAAFDPNDTRHGFAEFSTIPDFDSPPESAEEDDSSPSTPSRSSDDLPKGLFQRIQLAEGFEEGQGLRRGHFVYPVNPREVFSPQTRAVYVVFSVHKHYAAYQVFGRLYPEHTHGSPKEGWLDEDSIFLAAEDESGYLKLFYPSENGWAPGRYRVEIYVGFEVNPINHMGTLHFTIAPKS